MSLLSRIKSLFRRRLGEDAKGDHHAWTPKWCNAHLEKNDWQQCFSPKQYYDFLRQEVQREDNITNQRLTWFMAFQGFMITAVALLLSSPWPSPDAIIQTLPTGDQRPIVAFEAYIDIIVLRKVTIIVVGIIGFLMSIFGYVGVRASRDALQDVINDWRKINELLKIIPEMAPRAYGRDIYWAFSGGGIYAKWIPRLFILLWLGYVVFCVLVVKIEYLDGKTIFFAFWDLLVDIFYMGLRSLMYLYLVTLDLIESIRSQ